MVGLSVVDWCMVGLSVVDWCIIGLSVVDRCMVGLPVVNWCMVGLSVVDGCMVGLSVVDWCMVGISVWIGVCRGGSRGEAHPARAPPPPKIGKNMIFWRKIVIFHTKYPKKFRASLRSTHFF